MVKELIIKLAYYVIGLFGLRHICEIINNKIISIILVIGFIILTILLMKINGNTKKIVVCSEDEIVDEIVRENMLLRNRLRIITHKLDIEVVECEKDDYSQTGYVIREHIKCNDLTHEEFQILVGDENAD